MTDQGCNHNRRQPRHRPRCCALAAAARGYRIVVGYASNEAAAKEVVANDRGEERQGDRGAMRRRPRRAIFSRLFEAADKFGTLGALVNNAGIVGKSGVRVDEMSAERIQEMMAVNVTGSILCAREAVQAHVDQAWRQSGGVIVNISSVAARLGAANTLCRLRGVQGRHRLLHPRPRSRSRRRRAFGSPVSGRD